jgi:NAD(P)-dependent dehydrogenase (short-subunit alcohol dehydrogenase family)
MLLYLECEGRRRLPDRPAGLSTTVRKALDDGVVRDVSVSARTLQRDQVPEDVVGAVVYFASPGSAFVTGQTIVIDGGQYFH